MLNDAHADPDRRVPDNDDRERESAGVEFVLLSPHAKQRRTGCLQAASKLLVVFVELVVVELILVELVFLLVEQLVHEQRQQPVPSAVLVAFAVGKRLAERDRLTFEQFLHAARQLRRLEFEQCSANAAVSRVSRAIDEPGSVVRATRRAPASPQSSPN